MTENWLESHQYLANWIQAIVLLIALIPLSQIAGIFTISGEGKIMPGAQATVGNATCFVSVINGTVYNEFVNTYCPQLLNTTEISHLPLTYKQVSNIYRIENTTTASYVAFSLEKKKDYCYIMTICYS